MLRSACSTYGRHFMAYLMKGDFAVNKSADQVTKLDPNDATAFLNGSAGLAAHPQYERAIADYDQAITLAFAVSTCFVSRGSVCLFNGRFDHAIADFDEAIQLEPGFAVAFSVRANAYLKIHRNDRTLEDSKAATSMPLPPRQGILICNGLRKILSWIFDVQSFNASIQSEVRPGSAGS
jgi:tetratricopeptide (TPR) repeat protein